MHVAAKGLCGGAEGSGTTHRAADHLEVRVPVGTIVRDEKTGVLVGDLSRPGQRLRVANGGKGGRGNWELKNEKNSVPGYAELGEKGQGRWLDMQLKLLADVGVVGVPNAGKSSLLASVTNAKPKIADYPFTTVVPNLGVCGRARGRGPCACALLSRVDGGRRMLRAWPWLAPACLLHRGAARWETDVCRRGAVWCVSAAGSRAPLARPRRHPRPAGGCPRRRRPWAGTWACGRRGQAS